VGYASMLDWVIHPLKLGRPRPLVHNSRMGNNWESVSLPFTRTAAVQCWAGRKKTPVANTQFTFDCSARSIVPGVQDNEGLIIRWRDAT